MNEHLPESPQPVPSSPDRKTTDWLHPPQDQPPLSGYVQVLRERVWIVVLATAATMIAAVAYLLYADDRYEAKASMLVSPASGDDVVLGSLGVIRQTPDPAGAVETAAQVVTTNQVAERVIMELQLDETPQGLLQQVSVEPVAQSNILALTAEADTPAEAAELANTFAEAAVRERTKLLHDQIDRILREQKALLDGVAADSPATASSIAGDIARLELLLTTQDPTLRVEAPAIPPTDPSWPRPLLTIAGALLAGLVLGIGAAFTAQALDPRLRREEQLRSRYRLPILARIPIEEGNRSDISLAPGRLSPQTTEAYRTLRAGVMTMQRRHAGATAILITGSSPSEGKTTSAVNLASSLARAGKRTILIEADLRRPGIGRAFGVRPSSGIVSVLLGDARLEDALVTVPKQPPELRLLLADHDGGWIVDLFSLPDAPRMIDEAKTLADFVIVDSPPLTAVADALPLARSCDDTLIVVRLGLTRLNELEQLAEMLAGNEIVPSGFVEVGVPTPGRDYYYTQAPRPRGGERAPVAQTRRG